MGNARRTARRIVAGPGGACPSCGADDDGMADGRCGCDPPADAAPGKPGPMPPGRRIIPNPRGEPSVSHWPGADYRDIQ